MMIFKFCHYHIIQLMKELFYYFASEENQFPKHQNSTFLNLYFVFFQIKSLLFLMAFQRTSWKITNTSNKFLMKTNWHMAWITNSNTMSAFAVFSHLKEISSRIGNTTKKFSLILSRLKVKLELSISCRLWLYILLESINQSLENLPKHSWKNLLTNQFSAKSFCYNGTTKKFVLIKNAKFTIKKPRRNSVISSKISLSGWSKYKFLKIPF